MLTLLLKLKKDLKRQEKFRYLERINIMIVINLKIAMNNLWKSRVLILIEIMEFRGVRMPDQAIILVISPIEVQNLSLSLKQEL